MIYINIDENRRVVSSSENSQNAQYEVDELPATNDLILKTDFESFTGQDQYEPSSDNESKNIRIQKNVDAWIEYKEAINKQILNAQIDGETALEASLKQLKSDEKAASLARIQAIQDEV